MQENNDTRPAVVVLGGGPLAAALPDTLRRAVITVAADSGADHALAAGITPTLVVGDLDSISDDARCALTEAGVAFDRFDADKDATDGFLAIDAALELGASTITLVSGAGIDRLDHLLAVVALLAHPRADGVDLDAYLGNAHVQRARPERSVLIDYPAGSTVTLLPLFGTVEGVHTTGLYWPLDLATLPVGSSRGVSNLVVQSPATVSVTSGLLLVIVPEALA